MSHKENPDEAAVSLVRKRWDNASDEEKSEHARKMAEARWAGHVAKRPGAALKAAKGKKAKEKTAR